MRLIDADSAKLAVSDYKIFRCQLGGLMDVAEFIDDQPTIDAVPVVRCWECIHRYTENCPMFFHASYWHEGYEEYVDDDTDHTEDDCFCPEGKRKEGAI